MWLRVLVAVESLEGFLKPLSLSASGMALSDNEIIGAIKTGQFHIVPRNPKLNPAGIDLRADRSLVLRPGQQKLVATIERVELSENFLGILHIRSSLTVSCPRNLGSTRARLASIPSLARDDRM